jgi:hypothetical protein
MRARGLCVRAAWLLPFLGMKYSRFGQGIGTGAPSLVPIPYLSLVDPNQPRRYLLNTARKLLLDAEPRPDDPGDDVPRLTPRALERTRMSRSRDRIMENLETMYREAFERAKTTGDDSQMATLDFAYRREQLYLEILLDIREAVERR